MSFAVARNKRIIQKTLQILPEFFILYPESEKRILEEFYDALKEFSIDTQFQRTETLIQLQNYVNKVLYGTDYFILPFLWFTCSFIQNLIRFASLVSFHGDDYYKHFARVILGSDSVSLIQLIREKVPLTDLRWEQLQYFCLRLIPVLSDEEAAILREFKNLFYARNVIQFCPKELETYLERKLDQRNLTRKMDRLFTRLGAQYIISWNYSAFELEYLHLVIEISKETSLLDIFRLVKSLEGESNCDIFQLQWIYSDKNLPRCYTWMVIPRYYVPDFNAMFREMLAQDLFIIHTKDLLLEYGSWFSQIEYPRNKPMVLPALSTFITQIKKIEKKVPPSSDLPVFILNSKSSHYWRFNKQSTPEKYIDYFCQMTPQLGVNPFSSLKTCVYEAPTLEIIKELTENKIVAPAIRFLLLEQAWAMQYYYIQCPKTDFEFLPHLLQFLPSGFYGMTKDWVYLQTYCPPVLINQLLAEARPFNWLIRPIQDVYNPPPHNKDWFDYESLRWKKPSIIKSSYSS